MDKLLTGIIFFRDVPARNRHAHRRPEVEGDPGGQHGQARGQLDALPPEAVGEQAAGQSARDLTQAQCGTYIVKDN
jgi:hypothetical protein